MNISGIRLVLTEVITGFIVMCKNSSFSRICDWAWENRFYLHIKFDPILKI